VRRTLARLFGLALTLALTSIVALAALARLADGQVGFGALGFPLYFNAAPRNVHDLSQALVRRLAAHDDEDAARELARLGGAALPHVLPALDALAPSARGRVALALAPVARRMGVGGDDDFASPASAAAFWARFWQDRSFDFRPQVARRLVTRLAQRASTSARRDDIIQTDTYALPELIGALGRVRNADDVLRVERLTSLLAHVTNQGPVARRNTSVSEARSVVRKWQDFWLAQGSDFVTLDGPTRVIATLAQTRYGVWVGHALGVLRNRTDDRGSNFGIAAPPALASLLRLLFALILCALSSAALTRFEGRSAHQVRLVTRVLAALVLASGGGLVFSQRFASASAPIKEVLVVLLATALGAAVLSRPARVALGRRLDGVAPTYRDGLRAAIAGAPALLPWLTTVIFYAELSLGLDGVARAVLQALKLGDVAPGMSLALGGALISTLLVVLVDRTSISSEFRRSKPSLVEVDARRRHRLLGWAAAVLASLLIVATDRLAWGSSNADGWHALAFGARSLLGYGVVTVVVALGAGLALGALAANGPRSFDGALCRAVEVSGALPALLWAAALASAFGSGAGLAVALGLFRSLDVAWLLRSELTALARADLELGVRSLGHLPLAVYVRGRLFPAAMPALVAAALTPAWLLFLGFSARVAGFSASAGRPGWDALLAEPGTSALGVRLAALLLTTCVVWLLLAAALPEPRRLGAARWNPVSEPNP
jgi:peptide/nickel transport system permease protein